MLLILCRVVGGLNLSQTTLGLIYTICKNRSFLVKSLNKKFPMLMTVKNESTTEKCHHRQPSDKFITSPRQGNNVDLRIRLQKSVSRRASWNVASFLRHKLGSMFVFSSHTFATWM